MFLPNYSTYKNEELIKNAIQELQFPCIIWQIHHSLDFSKLFQNHQWICSFFYCILKPHMTLITEPRAIISSVKAKCGPNSTCAPLPFSLISLTTFLCTYMSLKSATWHHLHRWEICLHAVATSTLGLGTCNYIQHLLPMASNGHSAPGIMEGSQALSESCSPNSEA